MVPHSPRAPHFLIIPSLMYLHKRGHAEEERDIEASRDMQRLRDSRAHAEEEREGGHSEEETGRAHAEEEGD